MIVPVGVQALVEMTSHDAADHGIIRRDMIVSAGSYRRRPPRYLGINHIADPKHLLEHADVLTQQYPPVYRLVMEATVAGQGAVVTASDHLVAESVAEFLNHRQIPDGLRHGEAGLFEFAGGVTRHISKPSLLVKRPWWRNYGHWIVDGAALLAMIPWGIMPHEWQIVVGAHENGQMRRIFHDTLSVLAPNVPIVEQPDHEAWTFSHLHYITPVHIPPLFKLPAARHILQNAFLRDARVQSEPGRFYLQRGPQGGRAVVNENDLIDICKARGLSVIRPEQFSLREQARLFGNCEIVVGVKGAALTNAVFSSSSLSMVVLSPSTWTDPFFWDLVAQAGIDYTEIIGPVVGVPQGPSSNTFKIDPDALADALDDRIELLTQERQLHTRSVRNAFC